MTTVRRHAESVLKRAMKKYQQALEQDIRETTRKLSQRHKCRVEFVSALGTWHWLIEDNKQETPRLAEVLDQAVDEWGLGIIPMPFRVTYTNGKESST